MDIGIVNVLERVGWIKEYSMSLRGGWMDKGIFNVFEMWLDEYRDIQCL